MAKKKTRKKGGTQKQRYAISASANAHLGPRNAMNVEVKDLLPIG